MIYFILNLLFAHVFLISFDRLNDETSAMLSFVESVCIALYVFNSYIRLKKAPHLCLLTASVLFSLGYLVIVINHGEYDLPCFADTFFFLDQLAFVMVAYTYLYVYKKIPIYTLVTYTIPALVISVLVLFKFFVTPHRYLISDATLDGWLFIGYVIFDMLGIFMLMVFLVMQTRMEFMLYLCFCASFIVDAFDCYQSLSTHFSTYISDVSGNTITLLFVFALAADDKKCLYPMLNDFMMKARFLIPFACVIILLSMEHTFSPGLH